MYANGLIDNIAHPTPCGLWQNWADLAPIRAFAADAGFETHFFDLFRFSWDNYKGKVKVPNSTLDEVGKVVRKIR